jgi:hypothetical protein
VSSSFSSVLLGAVTESGLPSEQLDAAESISLLQALAAVPDPRKTRGRRHGLRSVLLLAVGAVLAAFVPVLDTVADLREVVVTADALHCTASAPTPTTCTPAARTICSPSRATSPHSAAR